MKNSASVLRVFTERGPVPLTASIFLKVVFQRPTIALPAVLPNHFYSATFDSLQISACLPQLSRLLAFHEGNHLLLTSNSHHAFVLRGTVFLILHSLVRSLSSKSSHPPSSAEAVDSKRLHGKLVASSSPSSYRSNESAKLKDVEKSEKEEVEVLRSEETSTPEDDEEKVKKSGNSCDIVAVEGDSHSYRGELHADFGKRTSNSPEKTSEDCNLKLSPLEIINFLISRLNLAEEGANSGGFWVFNGGDIRENVMVERWNHRLNEGGVHCCSEDAFSVLMKREFSDSWALSELLIANHLAISFADLSSCNVCLLIEALQLPVSSCLDEAINTHSMQGVIRTVGSMKNLLEDSKITRNTANLPALASVISMLRGSAYIITSLRDSLDALNRFIAATLAAINEDFSCKAILQGRCFALSNPGMKAVNQPSKSFAENLSDAVEHSLETISEILPAYEAALPQEGASIKLQDPIADISMAYVPLHPLTMSKDCIAYGFGLKKAIRERITDMNRRLNRNSVESVCEHAFAASLLLTECLIYEASLGLQILSKFDVSSYNAGIEKLLSKGASGIAQLKKKGGLSNVGKYNVAAGVNRYKLFLVGCLLEDESSVCEGGAGSPYLEAPERLRDALFKELRIREKQEEIALIVSIGNQGTRKPKVPKGTQDFIPQRMAVREEIITLVSSIFKRHGTLQIDTPVFELKETLMGKYGEDQKLIYDLKDQGGEQLSLRYDLTVPFARFLASQGIEKLKRFHIGKVYRRDEPQLSRGRFREFCQCDFDIAGHDELMVPDAEVLCVLAEILASMKKVIGPFSIKLNHRLLLDAMMCVCGVPAEKFRPICSAIDKLDKESWEEVRNEMITIKGLNPEVADKIEKFIVIKGSPYEALERLEKMEEYKAHEQTKRVLDEMKLLFNYLESFGVLDYITFDMSLARGLDYYTGVIYEAILLSGSLSSSVAAGGRYDKLVGMFSGKDIPAVGVSLGLERIFTIFERKQMQLRERLYNAHKYTAEDLAASSYELIRESSTSVLVCSIGDNLIKMRMKICSLLWKSGISCEFLYSLNPRLKKQLDYASSKEIPLVLILGEDELNKGTVRIKRLAQSSQKLATKKDSENDKLSSSETPQSSGENDEKEVAYDDIVSSVRSFLASS